MTILEKLTAAANGLQVIAGRVSRQDENELREISAMIRCAVAGMKRAAGRKRRSRPGREHE